MKFVLVFMANTASYRVHAETCSASTDLPKNGRHRIPETFVSVPAARAWADKDESIKITGRVRCKTIPGAASLKVCPCTLKV